MASLQCQHFGHINVIGELIDHLMECVLDSRSFRLLIWLSYSIHSLGDIQRLLESISM